MADGEFELNLDAAASLITESGIVEADPGEEEGVAAQSSEPEAEAVEEEGIEAQSDLDDEEEEYEDDQIDIEDQIEDEEEAESEPADTLYTVKVDGEERKVPLDELLRGYSGGQHINRGLHQLKAAREEFKAEREAVGAEREQYANILPRLIEVLDEVKPPDPKLNLTDPEEYARQKQRYDDVPRQRAAAERELEETRRKQAEDQRKQLEERVTQEQMRLLEIRPEWRDGDTWNTAAQGMLKVAQHVGYTPEEVAQAMALDHKLALIFGLASEALSHKANGKKALKSRKGRTRVATPGGSQPVSRRTVKAAKAADDRWAALEGAPDKESAMRAAEAILMSRES